MDKRVKCALDISMVLLLIGLFVTVIFFNEELTPEIGFYLIIAIIAWLVILCITDHVLSYYRRRWEQFTSIANEEYTKLEINV